MNSDAAPPYRQWLSAAATDLAGKSTILYVLGQILDLSTTFLLSPNLARETNVLVALYGFGWDFLLLSALVASLTMLAGQFWMWHRLVRRFPDEQLGYGRFYRHILGKTANARHASGPGAVLGIVCITLYGLIAAKLLAGLWNLSILAFAATTDSIIRLVLLKNALAAIVGLLMFFFYPYFLYGQARDFASRR